MKWLEARKLEGTEFARWQASFILRYGQSFRPRRLPSRIKPGRSGGCFHNCQTRLAGSSFVYCEGFALHEGLFPVHHAWLCTRKGELADLTWTAKKFDLIRRLAPIGVEYFGIPFKREYVLLRMLTAKASVPILDDWENNFPLWRNSPPDSEFLEELDCK